MKNAILATVHAFAHFIRSRQLELIGRNFANCARHPKLQSPTFPFHSAQISQVPRVWPPRYATHSRANIANWIISRVLLSTKVSQVDVANLYSVAFVSISVQSRVRSGATFVLPGDMAATSVVLLDRGNNTTCTVNLYGKSESATLIRPPPPPPPLPPPTFGTHSFHLCWRNCALRTLATVTATASHDCHSLLRSYACVRICEVRNGVHGDINALNSHAKKKTPTAEACRVAIVVVCVCVFFFLILTNSIWVQILHILYTQHRVHIRF